MIVVLAAPKCPLCRARRIAADATGVYVIAEYASGALVTRTNLGVVMDAACKRSVS